MDWIPKNIRLFAIIGMGLIGNTWVVANAYDMVLSIVEKQRQLDSIPEDLAVIKQQIIFQGMRLQRIENKLDRK